MGAALRLEPLLAGRSEHVPDDAEHRDQQLVPGRLPDQLVEPGVLVDVVLAGRDLPLLRPQDLVELGDLSRRDAPRGALGDGGLDQATDVDDVRDRVAARHEGRERLRQVFRLRPAHEGAATRARLDDPQELEGPQRLPHRRARDLELVRQEALRGELVARLQLASFEESLDLRDDPLVEPVTPYRLYERQRHLRPRPCGIRSARLPSLVRPREPPAPGAGLARWSGGLTTGPDATAARTPGQVMSMAHRGSCLGAGRAAPPPLGGPPRA